MPDYFALFGCDLASTPQRTTSTDDQARADGRLRFCEACDREHWRDDRHERQSMGQILTTPFMVELADDDTYEYSRRQLEGLR